MNQETIDKLKDLPNEVLSSRANFCFWAITHSFIQAGNEVAEMTEEEFREFVKYVLVR